MLEFLSHGFALAALALLVENLVGYPKFLQDLVGHPVQWLGKLIKILDDTLNHADSPPGAAKRAGITAVALMVLATASVGFAIIYALRWIPGGDIINVLLATTLLAQKSLREHVSKVASALGSSLAEARLEVAKIVGRDPDRLDESGISKATLESLAENTSDGIVAPALWYAVAGLPGLVIYKIINTADSMIGHKSERYLYFGWAAARIDDLVNLPASRLTGALFTATARLKSKQSASDAWASMLHDAHNHQSPNAGWPESAMAGALGLRFGGPRDYDGETEELPWMGSGRADINRADIAQGLELYDRSILLLAAFFFVLAIFL